MKKKLTIILLFASIFCVAQKKAEKLFDKAYDYSWKYQYRNNDTTKLFPPYYDSAIYFLKILNTKYPNYRTDRVDEIFQDSYFGNGEYFKSIEYSLKILSRYKNDYIKPEDISVESIFACKKIAESFLKIGEFKKSILYYDSCSTKYKGNFLQCGIGVMIDNAYSDKDLFFAHLGLKETKKAIEIATPYFFDSTMTEFIDSNYSKQYFTAIGEMYSDNQAKNEIKIAVESLKIKIEELYKFKNESVLTNNKVNLFGAYLLLIGDFPKELMLEVFKENDLKEIVGNKITKSVGYKFYYPEK